MKTSIKKLLASLTAAGMIFGCGTAFAAGTPVFDIDGNPVPKTEATAQEPSVSYNGATFTAQRINHDGVRTVPLREVMEQMGYGVAWNDEDQSIECVREETVVSLKIGDTRYYHYNKMAMFNSSAVPYAELNAAPYLYQDSVTYVPVNMLTTVLGVSVYDGTNDTITISEAAKVTLNSVQSDDDGTYLSVSDPMRGEVIVRISDTATALSENCDLTSIPAGVTLDIEYGLAMTMSIPPQTTAISVSLPYTECTADNADFSGTITESDIEAGIIVIDENGALRALNVDDDTKISHGLDKRIYKIDDLTVGTKITGVRDAAETRSIPPQSYAITIEIVD